MRGVHEIQRKNNLFFVGSSPHARGPLIIREIRFKSRRIIPACAGSTFALIILGRPWRDHPRMRGVHGFLHLCLKAL